MNSIAKTIKNIKDFPHKGILFRDLTPILYAPKIFNLCLCKFKQISKKYKFDVIVAPEARGF
jgi:adenine phosphoribosyltransferase